MACYWLNDEIINSGKLNLIQDQQLKVQLTKWSSILENAEEDIRSFLQTTLSMIERNIGE
ncbi:MAG: hypothetical protein ACWGNV_04440 [Bacteroidales bacterium]